MAKATHRTHWDEYLHIVRELEGDLEGRAAVDEYLNSGYIKMDGRMVRWATSPYVLNKKQHEVLKGVSATMGSIMEKVMAKYHRDRAFRRLFGLPKEVEELTLVPSGCHAAVPLSRLDLFFDPATCDFKIGTIVTGGVDGMVLATGEAHALTGTEAYRTFAAKHPSTFSYDPLHECVLSILHTYGKWANAGVGRNHPTRPSVAVVDVAGSPRLAETKAVVNAMQEMGCYARSTDFSQLRIETASGSTQLVDNHGPISCVWLRAKIDDVVGGKVPGLDTLVKATRRGMVCTVGGYRSWPCCTRSFFSVLRTKDCRALLTHEENEFVEAHLPKLHIIDASSDLSEYYDQQRWVIRTKDGDSRFGMLAGVSMSKMEWRTRLAKAIKRHDAVQEYIKRAPATVACVDEQGTPIERDVEVLLGLFTFEGRLAGISACCGTGTTVSDWKDYQEMGCIVVA